MLFFTQEFQTKGAPERNIEELHRFPQKYENSLKKKEVLELSSHAN